MSDADPIADPIADASRAAAARLAPDHGARLLTDVEAALYSRDNAPRHDQYLDPVALGGLIVAIATLAWDVYKDRRAASPDSPPPPADTISRAVRTEFRETRTIDGTTDRVISITVEETLNAATALEARRDRDDKAQ